MSPKTQITITTLGASKCRRWDRLLLAACLCLALADTVGAAEGSWQDDSRPKTASRRLSLDAQRALVCETVTDWAAYEVTELIRDDAEENKSISPEGMQVLHQIRLTEALASAAFDTLAPQANHDSTYRDAVEKMRAYLNEDRDGAEANGKQLVPVCQRTYIQMVAAGELSEEQVQRAKAASQESVAKLTQELQALTAQH